MGIVSNLTKKAFAKIFKNLADDLGVPIADVAINIAYKDGMHRFEAFKNGTPQGFVKIKQIQLDDYIGKGIAIDFTGGTAAIEMTISQAGPKYAKELNCAVDDIEVFMADIPGKLPKAVLMKSGQKVRSIDIDTEFLS